MGSASSIGSLAGAATAGSDRERGAAAGFGLSIRTVAVLSTEAACCRSEGSLFDAVLDSRLSMTSRPAVGDVASRGRACACAAGCCSERVSRVRRRSNTAADSRAPAPNAASMDSHGELPPLGGAGAARAAASTGAGWGVTSAWRRLTEGVAAIGSAVPTTVAGSIGSRCTSLARSAAGLTATGARAAESTGASLIADAGVAAGALASSMAAGAVVVAGAGTAAPSVRTGIVIERPASRRSRLPRLNACGFAAKMASAVS